MPYSRFLTSIGKTLALSVLVVTASTVSADAQRVAESRAGITSAPFVADGAVAQQAAGRKEPVVAGLLSWIVPGVGSFYAGNNRHGAIHLGVGVGSLIAMVAGAAAAVETVDINTGEVSGGGLGLLVVGYLVYVVNDVWSIFTAVFDANRHNTGSSGGRVVGELYLAPEVRGVGSAMSSPETGASGSRLGLQVLKLRF